MALISPAQISPGSTIDSSDVNNPINTIANEFNGNIDDNNIKTGAAINPAKLAQNGTLALKPIIAYKFRGYQNTAGNLGASPGLILYDTENFDTTSNFDTVTNKGRFTAPVTGVYFFSASFRHTVSNGNLIGANLYKNGGLAVIGNTLINNSGGAFTFTAVVSDLMSLTAGDYVEVYGSGTIGGAIATGTTATYFSGFLVSV